MNLISALPCPFCSRPQVYVYSRKTSGVGDRERYASQVRCRKCLARGPAVSFDVTVQPGFPDLNRDDPFSTVSRAEEAAIRRWNETASAMMKQRGKTFLKKGGKA